MQEFNQNICGIDEAGRGALAGPMAVAACVLKQEIDGLNDSKLLTPKKREILAKKITQNSKYLIIYFSNQDIDSLGISCCMRIALDSFKSYFSRYSLVFDGKVDYQSGIQTIIKADTKIAQVAAASILAKVARDRLMIAYDALYPEYGYASHKGYGSKAHIDAITKYGYGALGRNTFVIKRQEQRLF